MTVMLESIAKSIHDTICKYGCKHTGVDMHKPHAQTHIKYIHAHLAM